MAHTTSARDYVLRLELPEQAHRGAPRSPRGAPIVFVPEQQAVAVGSELTEFTERVPVDLRDAIADSILLAQLAANKTDATEPDVFRWYDKYVEVLKHIGWGIRDVEFQAQFVSDIDVELHKAIIPVMMSMLGPQAAAASLVLAVLRGLAQMDRRTPWITLFDQLSEHAHGAKFQVSHVDADEHGQPAISLICFGIKSERTITQVLFFKRSAQTAELKKAGSNLVVSRTRLESARDAIAQRVAPFIADYVAKIDI
jgi:hypothetical protein